MTRRLPPRLVLADMRRAGLEAPAAGEFLGSRLEDGARIVVWRVGAELLEQRVPLWNAAAAERRRAFRLVRGSG